MELSNNGINIVGDLLTNYVEIITKDDLLNKTGLNNINQLKYLQTKSCI